MTPFEGWESFYVIVGSSAGALIGLQFVVITLIADMPLRPGDAEASGAFTTPSVIHFAVVLFLSAVLSAPWKGINVAATLLCLSGVTGLVYEIVVARRLRAQTVYDPVFEDWFFHLLLPIVSYLMLSTAAVVACTKPHPALFAVAASALLLLFSGIHNAWDIVTYQVFVRRKQQDKPREGSPVPPEST